MHSIQNPFEDLLKFLHVSNFHTLDRTDMSDRSFKRIVFTFKCEPGFNDEL